MRSIRQDGLSVLEEAVAGREYKHTAVSFKYIWREREECAHVASKGRLMKSPMGIQGTFPEAATREQSPQGKMAMKSLPG